MMRWIVGSGVRLRRAVLAVAAAVLFVGVAQLRHLKVDVLPEFGPPTVEVQTEALGLSAAEVEQLITVPLEQDLLSGVAWLDSIRSRSIPGLSSVQLVFEPGTDLLRARQVVQERLTQAAGLPNVSKPPQMLQPVSSTGRVMMIGLSSRSLSPIELSVLARWTIRPKLLGVPGVANVAIWGQRERQLQVQVDPERLRRHGVTLQQVIETTGNSLWFSPLSFLEASTSGAGGFLDTVNQRLQVQHLSPVETAADLAQVAMVGRGGRILRLGEVTRVVQDHQPLIGDAVLSGGPGLLLVVQKLPGANTLDVTHGVDSAIDALRPGLPGVRIDSSIFRPATYVEASIRHVARAMAVGFVLLVLVLVLLFLEWRTALIAAVTVPLSMAAAGLVLYLRGVTIDTVVVAGLVMALAAVVDDAVVDAEILARNLRRRRREGDGESVARIVLASSLQMRGAAWYATLVVLAVTAPAFFLGGEPGALLPPLVLSYALAVLASMAVALVVTPALALALLPASLHERPQPPPARRLQRGYDQALSKVFASPGPAYAAVGLVAVAGLAVTPFLRPSLVPAFRDADVLVHWDAAPGTSLPEMSRITARAGRELRSIPGVLDVGAHVGRAVASDQVVGVDSGELWVSIDPSADYDATMAAVRRVVAGYPGVDQEVLTYPNDRIGGVLGQADDPIDVRVFGQDLGVLRAEAEEVRRALAGIRGVVGPSVEAQVDEPTVAVRVDLAAARRHGIKPGDVRRAAATLLSGLDVGSLFEEQKVFDVVVRGAPRTRSSLSAIRGLLIDTPNRGQVPLGRVASVRIAPDPQVIRHDSVSRSVDVTADVRGRSVDSVAAEVRSRIQAMRFPLEYHAELVGDYAERQAVRRRLLAVAVAAAVGAFLLLQAAFASWRLAALSFLILPVGLAGGLLAAFVDGRVVSIGSLAGFLAVLAVAVRNGVALIRRYQGLERDEGVAFGPDLVLRGSRERLVPILVTAAATAAAFAPLAAWGDVAGQEVLHPMAVVILGGLATATLVDLFALPALYLRLGAGRVPEAPGPRAMALPEAQPVGKS
jgi:CzcA family heavy metal efflux pump